MPVAIRFLEQASRGASAPGFFKCDDGEDYLLKFNSNGMDRLLTNEFIVYYLAQKLGLPIPEGQLINIHPSLLISEPFLAGRNQAVVFGFKRVKINDNILQNGTFRMSWVRFIKEASNIKSVPDIMVFDMWVRNFDRAGLQQNYGNLIRVTNGKLNIIDHGHALGGVTDLPERTAVLDNPLGSGFFADGPITKALAFQIRVDNGTNPFQGIISRINAIQYNDIKQIVDAADAAWGLSPGEADKISGFLEQRKAVLKDVVDHLVYKEGYFINWKGEQLTWI